LEIEIEMNTKKEALKELAELHEELKVQPKPSNALEVEVLKLRLQIIETALTNLPQII